jgi:ABC-type protease/lipase transport system fused ATPase/permease subunit
MFIFDLNFNPLFMEELFSEDNQIITTAIIGVLLLLLMSIAFYLFSFFHAKKSSKKSLKKSLQKLNIRKI